MPLDLTMPHNRKMLAERIGRDIDEYCVKTFEDGPRKHLGASLLGHECARYLQYTYRWMHHRIVDGRMQRLFKRGHNEEASFVQYLRGIGFTVWQFQEDGVTQYRCSALGQHFGGSLDGINLPPSRYDVAEQLLCEFKTNKEGSFDRLKTYGVQKEKGQHYVQMCTYGKFYKLRYGLYMNKNKDNDDIYIEIAELDWSLADERMRLAEQVINAKTLMPRCSESPTYWKCKSCDMKGICHEGHKPMTNCRSCKWSEPIDGGKWQCNGWQAVIPDNVIPVGCERWQEFGK